MKKINCYVLDDEPLASGLICDYILKTPELQLIGVENSPTKALHDFNTLDIDICFIDIQMPELTGLELMQVTKASCKFIITSAYQEYALPSYEHSVIDYLLKPISYSRFLKAIYKLKQFTTNPHQLTKQESFIFIKNDKKYTKIALDDLQYIQALKDYLCFHLVQEQIIILGTMKFYEEQLTKHNFIRIHKSYLVNPLHIESIEDNAVYLKNNWLPIGKVYKQSTLKKLTST